jgi:hypothetical protein
MRLTDAYLCVQEGCEELQPQAARCWRCSSAHLVPLTQWLPALTAHPAPLLTPAGAPSPPGIFGLIEEG